MKSAISWVKQNPRKIAVYVGVALIGSGLICLIPWSPWTLVIVGTSILVVVLASYMPVEGYSGDL